MCTCSKLNPCDKRYPYQTAVRQTLACLRERQLKLQLEAEAKDEMNLRGEEGSGDLWARVEELGHVLSALETSLTTDYLILNAGGPR